MLGIARVLDHEIKARLPDGVEDGHFLGLEVEIVLAPGCRGHERHPEPIPVQALRRARGTEPTRHSEQLRCLSEEPALRGGQQLVRGPQQRPRRRGRSRRRPDLEHQRRRRRIEQARQLAEVAVEPPIQRAPHREQRLLLGAAAHGIHILACDVIEQADVRGLQLAAGTDTLAVDDQLKSAGVHNQPGNHKSSYCRQVRPFQESHGGTGLRCK